MRNTRNFWIEAKVDGRKTTVGTGPRQRLGGFKLNVLMRDHGAVTTALMVKGHANEDGTLTLLASTPTSETLKVQTER